MTTEHLDESTTVADLLTCYKETTENTVNYEPPSDTYTPAEGDVDDWCFDYRRYHDLPAVRGVYVLCLAHGNYYVGQSENVPKRIHFHFKGEGSEWTKKNKPYKVAEIHPQHEGDLWDLEVSTTREYVLEYGPKKVRGGPFVTPEDPFYNVKQYVANKEDEQYRAGRKRRGA